MVKARKDLAQKVLNWAGGVAFTLTSIFSGGCLDEYAGTGAGLKAASGFSRSPGAGAAAYALGEAVSRTGDYRANERVAEAGRSETNVYFNGNPQGNNNYNSPISQEEGKEMGRQLRELDLNYRAPISQEEGKELARAIERDIARRKAEATAQKQP